MLDRSDNVSMNFALSGPGALLKTGSDTATLTGNSEQLCGSGQRRSRPALLAGPSIVGQSAVNSGGTLQFSGGNFVLGSLPP